VRRDVGRTWTVKFQPRWVKSLRICWLATPTSVRRTSSRSS